MKSQPLNQYTDEGRWMVSQLSLSLSDFLEGL